MKDDIHFIAKILDAVPISLACKDVQDGYKYVFWNKKSEEYTGISAEQVLGKRMSEVLPHNAHLDDLDYEIARTGQTVEVCTLDFVSREGKNIYLQNIRVPIFDSEGKVTHILALFEDITAKRKAELDLKQAQQAVFNSAKMAAMGEMAGGIAHEINNPLAVICLHAAGAGRLAESGDIAKVKTYAKEITATALRIAKVVSGLRAFARDASNDKVISFDLREFIRETTSFCRARFAFSGVKFLVSHIPELMIEGKKTELSQALLAILINAYEAVSHLQEKWIKLEIRENEGDVQISVIDSGAGISPVIQEKIMLPFFTTKEIGEGMGLGLSISKGIIESHSGALTLDVTKKNTTFVILLPKQQKRVLQAAA